MDLLGGEGMLGLCWGPLCLWEFIGALLGVNLGSLGCFVGSLLRVH